MRVKKSVAAAALIVFAIGAAGQRRRRERRPADEAIADREDSCRTAAAARGPGGSCARQDAVRHPLYRMPWRGPAGRRYGRSEPASIATGAQR